MTHYTKYYTTHYMTHYMTPLHDILYDKLNDTLHDTLYNTLHNTLYDILHNTVCRKRQIWSSRLRWQPQTVPFSLAEQCHTQNFYLRCFKSDFDAVKSKFGLLIK